MSTMVSVRFRFVPVQRREWLRLGLMTLGLLFAFYAQRAIYNDDHWTEGAVFYLIAFVTLIAAWRRMDPALAVPIRAEEEASPVAYRSTSQRFLVVPSALFAVISFLTLVNNTFTPVGTTAWISSLILFLLAFWDGTFSDAVSRAQTRFANWTGLSNIVLKITWSHVVLLGIIALGIYFYLYRLDAIPAEMTSDHAEKIYDTYDILQGKHSIFFERNTGREPLQFYLNAAVVALGIAPLDHIALKIVTAVAGLLSVPALFLLAREWFDTETGLYSAFFMAVSIWPVAIARVGLRYPLAPLFVALSLFFMVRALRRGTRNDFLLAGLMMGVGLNGYSPFRVELLVAVFILGVWAYTHRAWVREHWSQFLTNIGLMFAGTFLVFLPLFRYTLEHPQNFFYRSATRLTSSEVPIEGNPLFIFLDNFWNAAQMFNVRGDPVWVNSLPNYPVVDYVTGALVLIGAAYAAYRLIRKRELPFLYLFVGIFILLLPSTLSIAFPNENPSVVRAGGASPLVMILAALPLVLWQRQFRALGSRWLGLVVVIPILFWCAKINSDLYFYAYDDQYRRAGMNTTEIASVLRAFAQTQGDKKHIYVVLYPYWVDHRAVGIHLGEMHWDEHLVQNADTLRAQVADPAPKLYAVNKDDKASLKLLRELYPKGVQRLYRSRTPDRNFISFYAPGVNGGSEVVEEPTAPIEPPKKDTVTEKFDLDGETIEITHSVFDSGRVNDLFDHNLEFLARGKEANPLVVDIIFPKPRAIKGLGIDLTNGEYTLHAGLYARPDGKPVEYEQTFLKLPVDPHLDIEFDKGPAEARRIRLEITMLHPPDEVHVHVRELEFK